jgi:hypothetical protein
VAQIRKGTIEMKNRKVVLIKVVLFSIIAVLLPFGLNNYSMLKFIGITIGSLLGFIIVVIVLIVLLGSALEFIFNVDLSKKAKF